MINGSSRHRHLSDVVNPESLAGGSSLTRDGRTESQKVSFLAGELSQARLVSFVHRTLSRVGGGRGGRPEGGN